MFVSTILMSIPVKSETFLKSIKSMLFLSRVGCFDFFALQMAEKDILYITLSNLKCQGDFLCDQVGCYSRKDMLRKPFGAMVSSADLVPVAPSA